MKLVNHILIKIHLLNAPCLPKLLLEWIIINQFDKLGQISCNVNRCLIAKLKYPLQNISVYQFKKKKDRLAIFRVLQL